MKKQTMEHAKKESPNMEEQKLPQKKISKKAWVIAFGTAAVLFAALVVGILAAMGTFREEEGVYAFTLSQRDVAVELGETMQLEVVPDKECRRMRPEITWISSDPAVASVSEDGSVTALAGGEARITAIARYQEEECSASCMVTVKAPGFEYSDYRVRWFTQSKDRGTYMVKEETFERLVGSEVELDEKYAMRMVPVQYVLNKEKSVWSGQVKELPGQCILEVYYDVGEIEYYVDYYYESDKKLGAYTEKETKAFTTYAFSPVKAEENPREGFTLNREAQDAVTEMESVEAGDRLSVYYDRVRCKVTVTYVTGRETAVYTNVYGYGLVDAPEDALTDSMELYDATVGCYLNGNRSENIYEDLKKVAWNSVVQVRMESMSGWIYDPKTGYLLNLAEHNTTSYAYLQGASNTICLSATYDITGSQTNMFGITLRSGDTSRQFWFADRGVYVRKDHGYDSGIIGDEQFRYNNAGFWDGGAFVWAQNNEGAWGTHISSTISNMIKNTASSSHRLTWVVYEGVLYGNIDGETVLRLPLNHFVAEWTADKPYQIGFSTFDGPKDYDELKIRDVSISFGDEAKARLNLAGEVKSARLNHVAYDVITGCYLPASSFGFTELGSSATAGNVGVSADIWMQNMGNTTAGYGVTISDGESSVQYLLQGNDQARRQKNFGWDDTVYMNMNLVTAFDDKGSTHVDAFVKDGYFYIKYNGVQTQCVNMLSLFPGYRPGETKVTVGLCSCDANLGLARYYNVKLLSEAEVAAAESQQWGFYADEPIPGKYDFEEGTLAGARNQWTVATMPGGSKIWQVEGVMERTDSPLARAVGRLASRIAEGVREEDGDTTSRIPLRMGIGIASGGKELRLMGDGNGLLAHDGDTWLNEFEPATWKKYVLNSKADAFFNGTGPDKLSFRAVIYRDVLYMWFDGELCWQVPLTENQFGTDADPRSVSFSADSEYQLRLCLNESGHNGKISGLKVTMDYQVTEQTDFVKDKDGNSYSFLEAIGMLEEAAADTSENTNMRQDPFTGDYIASAGIWDAYLYGDAAVGDLGVSADIGWQLQENHDSATGIYLRAGDLTHSFMNWSQGDNYHASYRHILRSESQEKNLAETNILDQVCANVYPVKEDGTSHVDAFVKDGYFYINYNGTQALCISMVSLFADYDPAATKVAIGIGGNQMNLGPATFSNVAFHTPEQVAALPSVQWNTYSEYVISDRTADVYSLKDGSFERRKDRDDLDWMWTGMPLYGTQKIWQVEGTMARTDAKDATQLAMGFGLSSGGKELRIMGGGDGIKVSMGDGWYKEWDYMNLNSYVLSNRAKSIFANPRISDEISFRAVVYRDVLYVWFDGELCWNIPLRENEFENGTFPVDSDYQLTLWMSDLDGCGRMSGLKTLMGYQVTEQTDFMKGADGKTYGFLEAMELLEKTTPGDTNMRQDPFTGDYIASAGIWDAYLYGKPAVGDRGVSADISWQDPEKHESATGVYLRAGDLTHSFMIWSEGDNYNASYRHILRDKSQETNLAETNIINQVSSNVLPVKEDGTSHVDAFIKDGYFYINYNGTQALCISMVSLFGDYDPTATEVTIGIGGNQMNLGPAKFANVAFRTAEEVAALPSARWDTYSEYVTSDRTADVYSLKDGTFERRKDRDDLDWMWTGMPLYGTQKIWQVEGTMARTDARDATQLAMGFGLSCGGKELRIMGGGAGIKVSMGDGWYNEWAYMNQNSYVFSSRAEKVFANPRTADEIAFRAVVYKDVLYVWFEEELCWRIPLTENEFENGTFPADSDYQLTLWMSDLDGCGRMSGLKTLMGCQATEQTDFYKDANGKTYSFLEAMELLETESPYKDTNMRLDAFTGDYIASAGTWDAYLYGEPAVGDLGVSADISWKEPEKHDSATGVYLRAGDLTHSFMTWSEGDNYNASYRHILRSKSQETNLAETDILKQVCASVYPVKEDGTSHVDAFVKDGYFYISYNGTQALCISMASLFADYDPAVTEVTIGVGGNQMNLGPAKFANVTFHTPEEVAALPSTQWKIYGELTPSDRTADVYNMAEGSFERGTDQGKEWIWTGMPLYGMQKTWQVEGTMTRTDARDVTELPMGIGISSGGKELRIVGSGAGIKVHNGSDWCNEWNYLDLNSYVLNTRAGSFFANPRTVDEVAFKAVVYEDVLYVWFDGELCWRVPLTENEFENGSFPAGSDYQLTLWMGDTAGCGRMSGLEVVVGRQVTGQDGFVEQMENLEARAREYLAADRSGMMLEAEQERYATGASLNGVATLYGKPVTGNQGVSVDISLDADAHMGTGIVIKSGNQIHQFQAWHDKDTRNWWLGHLEGGNLLMSWEEGPVKDILNLLPFGVVPYDDNDCSHVDAFVKDGYFYICYNGRQALCMNMAALFAGYDPASTEAAIGITGTKGAADVGQARFSNVAFLSGEETAAKAEELGVVQKNFYAESVSGGGSLDLENGSVTVSESTADWKTVVLPGISKTWQVEGTVEIEGRQWIGFGVVRKSDGAKLQLIGYQNGIVPKRFDEGGENPSYGELNTSYVLSDKAAGFFADPGEPTGTRTISFRAVVAEDILYVWFDGELCWCFPLYENEFAFNLGKGNDYEFMLSLGSYGTKKLSSLNVKMGGQVTGQEEFITDSDGNLHSFQNVMEILQKLPADKWGMMLKDPFKGNYMTASDLNGVARLYGEKAIGNQGVSVDISLDADAHMGAGIVIKSGDRVHQFQAWHDNSTTKNWWLGHLEGENLLMSWDSGPVKDILNLLPSGVVPYDDNDSCHVDAFVKDGYFYICYNGKQALCMDMAALFADYDPASTEAAIGITGTKGAADVGQARFSNVAFLSGEETAAKAEALGIVQKNFYAENVSGGGTSLDLENGSVTVTDTNSGAWKNVILPGSSKNWQVEGTMEITGRQWIGFGVRAGGNTLELLGYNDKIVTRKNGGLDFDHKYSNYVLNSKASGFFADDNQSNARQISFRAVVTEDVLYVWFDGELCWRVPLYENEFAFNLGKGNEYEFVLTLGDWGLVKISNLNVKMGWQASVTEQENFFTDRGGTSYSYTDAMALFKTRLPVENSGMIPEDPFAGTYLTANTDAVWAYGEKAVGNCGMSADVAWVQGNNLNGNAGTFVSVRIGGEKRIFMGFSEGTKMNNGLFYLTEPELWNNKFYPGFWGTDAQMGELPVYLENGTTHVEAYVQDGILHIKYNGAQLVEKSMAELFPAGSGDYSADSEISFGIGGLQTNQNQARFTNVVFQ
nr:Ig-like domain-containing protein [uncultured Acetatifactor sp.]